ncbi:hypothetical protein BAE44_0018909, partial [Dichanthelium oligosanthes]
LLNLPDAKICPVQSPSDVINLMQLGEKHRASGSTAMNHKSSRSHSILTVHVNGKDIAGNVSCSSLHLVDLAGSERVDRNSKLTQLLQSSLELGTAHANKESNEIRDLKEQVDTLKKALASKELEKASLKLKENTIVKGTPCRSRNMCTEVSHSDDPSSTAKLEKVMTSTPTKKGSHLRKSIQSSIGRLIHGSERRNAQHSAQGTPAKITTNTCHDIAPPVTGDIRLRRRQSLTGSNDKRGAKTPPPVNSAAKVKRWV